MKVRIEVDIDQIEHSRLMIALEQHLIHLTERAKATNIPGLESNKEYWDKRVAQTSRVMTKMENAWNEGEFVGH